jgi:hypothetical protein
MMQNDDKYEGEIKNGKPHGKGILKKSNGDMYTGEFRDGYFHGQGTLTFLSGTVYLGEFKHDEWDGYGIYNKVDGTKYCGEWKKGYMHGYGIYSVINGFKHTGEWKEDEQDGYGITNFSNGDKYIGEWRNGKQNGNGTYFYKDGTINKSIWKNGQDIGEKNKTNNVNQTQILNEHPIINGEEKVKVKSILVNKGKWIPKPNWQELSVEFQDGTILTKVRHKTSNFEVVVGQEVVIVWLVPKNNNSPWYYTKYKAVYNENDKERIEQEKEWKMLIEDVNPMSDDEKDIFK